MDTDERLYSERQHETLLLRIEALEQKVANLERSVRDMAEQVPKMLAAKD